LFEERRTEAALTTVMRVNMNSDDLYICEKPGGSKSWNGANDYAK